MLKPSKDAFLTCFLVAVATLAMGSKAFADILKLKNSGEIQGQITDVTDPAGLHFRAGYGQLMFVPWDHVEALKNTEGESVERRSEAQSDANPFLMARQSAAPNQSPSTSVQPALIEPAAGDTKQEEKTGLWGAVWSGQVDLGGEIESGNSETEAFAADYRVEANWNDIHRASLALDIDWEEESGEKVEDEQELQLQYDYFYSKKWFLASAAEFQRDDIQELDLRYSLGLGAGYQPYRGDDLSLRMVLRPTYFEEEFSDGSEDNGSALEWDLDYKQKVFEGRFSVFHNHDLLVPSDETDAFLFESESGLRVPIVAGIVGSTGVDFDWDNDPEEGVNEDDTKYTVKLGYEW